MHEFQRRRQRRVVLSALMKYSTALTSWLVVLVSLTRPHQREAGPAPRVATCIIERRQIGDGGFGRQRDQPFHLDPRGHGSGRTREDHAASTLPSVAASRREMGQGAGLGRGGWGAGGETPHFSAGVARILSACHPASAQTTHGVERWANHKTPCAGAGFRSNTTAWAIAVPWTPLETQTQRAVQNFPVSGRHAARLHPCAGLVRRLPPASMPALACCPKLRQAIHAAALKWPKARTMRIYGRCTRPGHLVEHECQRGDRDAGFARRARSINDHVNLGQSSNDVVPTAIRVRATGRSDLLPALNTCARPSTGVRGVRQGGQDRAHAPDGRDAADRGAGFGARSSQLACRGAPPMRSSACGGCRSAPPSAPASTRIRSAGRWRASRS